VKSGTVLPALAALPIQAPVLDRLGEMLLTNGFTPLQVGNRSRHLEYPGKGAGGESQPVGDQFQHPVPGSVQFAVPPEMAGVHLGVAVNFRPPEAISLDAPGAFHPTGNHCGTFRLGPVGQVAIANRGNLHVEVDPVQKRSGDPGAVPLEHYRGAGALVSQISQVAAGARVHGGDQHEAGGIGHGGERPGDAHPTVLQRLAENFQDMFLEFYW
jgi:hypothetical protein